MENFILGSNTRGSDGVFGKVVKGWNISIFKLEVVSYIKCFYDLGVELLQTLLAD